MSGDGSDQQVDRVRAEVDGGTDRWRCDHPREGDPQVTRIRRRTRWQRFWTTSGGSGRPSSRVWSPRASWRPAGSTSRPGVAGFAAGLRVVGFAAGLRVVALRRGLAGRLGLRGRLGRWRRARGSGRPGRAASPRACGLSPASPRACGRSPASRRACGVVGFAAGLRAVAGFAAAVAGFAAGLRAVVARAAGLAADLAPADRGATRGFAVARRGGRRNGHGAGRCRGRSADPGLVGQTTDQPLDLGGGGLDLLRPLRDGLAALLVPGRRQLADPLGLDVTRGAELALELPDLPGGLARRGADRARARRRGRRRCRAHPGLACRHR